MCREYLANVRFNHMKCRYNFKIITDGGASATNISFLSAPACKSLSVVTIVVNRFLFNCNWESKKSQSGVDIDDFEKMKIIYVNCSVRNWYESDLHSNEHYLSSSENKAWKKIQACAWLPQYRCSALPTELTS